MASNYISLFLLPFLSGEETHQCQPNLWREVFQRICFCFKIGLNSISSISLCLSIYSMCFEIWSTLNHSADAFLFKSRSKIVIFQPFSSQHKLILPFGSMITIYRFKCFLYLWCGLLLYIIRTKGLIFYCAYQNPTQILLYLVDLMNTFDLQIDRILSPFFFNRFYFFFLLCFHSKITAFDSSKTPVVWDFFV